MDYEIIDKCVGIWIVLCKGEIIMFKNLLKTKRIAKIAVLGVALVISIRTMIDIYNAEVVVL